MIGAAFLSASQPQEVAARPQHVINQKAEADGSYIMSQGAEGM